MVEATPDVSVIITTFNVERYVSRAIESALAQSGVALEIIIIDDASSDRTWEIVSTFSDSRIKRRRLGVNSGPSAARNAGIEMASGRWLAVLDGDDQFLPGRLQRCLERARKQSAHIVVDNIKIAREADGKTFAMFTPRRFAGMETLDLARFIGANRMFMRGYTLGYLKPIFSAEFLRTENLTYDSGLRIGEDYLLLAEALAKGAICAVEPVEGYAYTVRAGSISHRLSLADIDSMLTADKKFLDRGSLNKSALKAQRQRSKSLKQMRAFTLIVTALKQRNLAGFLKAAFSSPQALRHLWRPVWVRLQRILP